jgi:hypothetical protein
MGGLLSTMLEKVRKVSVSAPCVQANARIALATDRRNRYRPLAYHEQNGSRRLGRRDAAHLRTRGTTMQRDLVRSRLVHAWPLLALWPSLAVLLTCGCSMLPALAWVIHPEDVAAEYEGLNGKRVAVVCRATSLEYAHPTVSRELAVRVAALLQTNCRKVEVVDERELADWVDNHGWHDYHEVGRALKADLVVGMDLERFELSRGSTLLQGQADVRLAVYDVKSNTRAWDPGRVLSVKYPPNSPYAAADRQEDDFRRQFLGVLAERVARHFYDYDSRKDFAQDATVLK